MGYDKTFDEDLKEKIDVLVSSLTLENHPWTEWEYEFIESIGEKLKQKTVSVSPKQLDKIWDLYERL